MSVTLVTRRDENEVVKFYLRRFFQPPFFLFYFQPLLPPHVRVCVCAHNACVFKKQKRERKRESVFYALAKSEREREIVKAVKERERDFFRKNQRPRKSSKNLSLAHQTHSLLCLIFTPKSERTTSTSLKWVEADDVDVDVNDGSRKETNPHVWERERERESVEGERRGRETLRHYF